MIESTDYLAKGFLMDHSTMHFPSGDEEIEDLADEALTGDQLIEIAQSW